MDVIKFGGTSLQTASIIHSATSIIAANRNARGIVVSAIGGITDLLLDFCKAYDIHRALLADRILRIHLELIETLQLKIKPLAIAMAKRLNGVVGILNEQTIDHIIALGEDLSSLIIAEYLNSQGIRVLHIDARTFLATDNHHGKALPNLEQIQQYKFPSSLFVTQGFIGLSSEGNTTTLGRGGSDYSAALIAEAIGAKKLLIYTDTPGVHTMDPHILPEALPIPKLDLHEMATMANYGAKILHPATLEPCIRAQIPVHILSTFLPKKRGTIININKQEVDTNTEPVKAITMREDQSLIVIKSLNSLNTCSFLANILKIITQHKTPIDLIVTSAVSVALIINKIHCTPNNHISHTEWQILLSKLQQFAVITIEENLTLITIIGKLSVQGTIQEILALLQPYNIRTVCYGADQSSISILLPEDIAVHAVHTVHKRYISAH